MSSRSGRRAIPARSSPTPAVRRQTAFRDCLARALALRGARAWAWTDPTGFGIDPTLRR